MDVGNSNAPFTCHDWLECGPCLALVFCKEGVGFEIGICYLQMVVSYWDFAIFLGFLV